MYSISTEPNITVVTADIQLDITFKYNDTSQTTIPYILNCSDGLSDNMESSNSSNSTLTTRTWFVNGNKHHVRDRVFTIRIGSDVLDVVGIYQCFVRNYTHEISVAYRLIADSELLIILHSAQNRLLNYYVLIKYIFLHSCRAA